MNIRMRFTGTLAMAFFLVLATGCANTETTTVSDVAAPAKTSGFLGDYEKLQPVEGHDSATTWRNPDVDWKQYDKVLIERMLVFLKEDKRNKSIDPTDLKMLIDYFHEALVKELEPTAAIVDKPGPGVLRVRIAIINLVPTSGTTSLAATAIPYGMAAEIGAGMATSRPIGSAPYLGETEIEAQFLDGVTGQVVAEFADNMVGSKYVVELEEGVTDAATKWAGGYFGSFQTWGYAEGAFTQWAKLFREQFDQLRGLNKM